MSAFDMIVLVIVGVGAIGGFARGFVQEVLSLLAWAAGVMAVRLFHSTLAAAFAEMAGSPTPAAILAFVLLLFVPYAVMTAIARQVGRKSRGSVLGPIDRVLGFGFGAVKGVVMTVVGFSILVLGYDSIWGAAGRPVWMTEARSYQFVDAASEAMVEMIAERRAAVSASSAVIDNP